MNAQAARSRIHAVISGRVQGVDVLQDGRARWAPQYLAYVSEIERPGPGQGAVKIKQHGLERSVCHLALSHG